MENKRKRYRQFERIMGIALLADAGLFVLFLIFAGMGSFWPKAIAAVLAVLLASCCLCYLYITKEIFKRRSLWMTVGAAAIILCIFASVLLNYPSGTAVDKPAETKPVETKPSETKTTTAATDEAHVHNYVETVTAPSCEEGGYSVFRCDCGDEYTDKQSEALGHDTQEEIQAASASAPGYTQHTCSRCGKKWQDTFTWLAETPTDFFDDAVFIGDSITLGLRNFNYQNNWLGDATILCQGSYSVAHAVNNTMYLSFRGEDMTPQKALAACGAQKVFILLGMNDIALHGVDKSLENWGILVDNIRGACPDIAIYIQSGTPIYTPGQKGSLNNERMDEYNGRLKTFAEENGCIYLDVATAMKDDTNGMAAEYTSDAYVHLTEAACRLWVEQLKNYVGQ